jgi:hypothetical protein
MATPTDNWTYAEFHAFTMLFAANADGEITPDERNLIISTLPLEEYDHIKSVFMDCDDNQAIEIILSYRDKYCSTQADKDKILADMQEVCNTNESVKQIERGVLQMFKRML